MDEALTAIDLGGFASRRVATEAAGRLRCLGIANTIEQSAGVTDEWATIRLDPTGCHVCEVEIDPETGVVEMQRYCVVEDVGTVLNPMLLRGQLQGGIVQGFGQIVLERFVLGSIGAGDFEMPATPERIWRVIREARS